MPIPSTETLKPEPANVDTAPSGVTKRTRLLPPSVTIAFPKPSMRITRRGKNCATVPNPSRQPHIREPASVVTTPARVTMRILQPVYSATKRRLLNESNAALLGKLKAAKVPVPSIEIALPLPARVVAFPRSDKRRIRWLPWSTTARIPSANCATSSGFAKAAFVPTPLLKALDPDPASEVT